MSGFAWAKEAKVHLHLAQEYAVVLSTDGVERGVCESSIRLFDHHIVRAMALSGYVILRRHAPSDDQHGDWPGEAGTTPGLEHFNDAAPLASAISVTRLVPRGHPAAADDDGMKRDAAGSYLRRE